ncbi:MAG: 7-carboxy-7-deazaguanine synthase QueE [Ferruginibacter sp.]
MKDVREIIHELPVMESFYTLQGEGFYQGAAAYFIRLGGCDVGCSWCDVKESWDASQHPVLSVDHIVCEAAMKVPPGENKLVVITGGEPLLHDLHTLTSQLQKQGFITNLETSGTRPVTGYWNWICLSPKKFKQPLPEVTSAADELKIIVYNLSDFAWGEKFASQVKPGCKLYLQPEWSKAEKVTPAIVDYIKDNPKWQLSLQIHKYIEVP